jgi:sensor histidine kinase regulating citrate/malate metabolism
MSDTIRVSASPSSEEPTLLCGGRSTIDLHAEKRHAVIIPMDVASIQRIVAGQAITDLASAVKELIDNALDAGSKTINSKSIVLFERPFWIITNN